MRVAMGVAMTCRELKGDIITCKRLQRFTSMLEGKDTNQIDEEPSYRYNHQSLMFNFRRFKSSL